MERDEILQSWESSAEKAREFLVCWKSSSETEREKLYRELLAACEDDPSSLFLDEWELRQFQITKHAASEGAWYYNPESPTIWKQYIVGPVPWWQRVLWWFFPPSPWHMRQIQKRQS